MPLTIHSPHSGHPVKIRDEDIGRAVRDEANRIFYVVPRASGEGYYGAITRKGSAKDEERYDRLAANPAAVAAARAEAASGAAPAPADTAPPHDATGGRKRRRPVRRALLTLAVLGALAAAGLVGLDRAGLLPAPLDCWVPDLGGAADPQPPARPTPPAAPPAS